MNLVDQLEHLHRIETAHNTMVGVVDQQHQQLSDAVGEYQNRVSSRITKRLGDTKTLAAAYDREVAQLIDIYRSDIDQAARRQFASSSSMFTSERVDRHSWNWITSLSDSEQQSLFSAAGVVSSWHWPTLLVGARNANTVKPVLASNPLYMTNHHREDQVQALSSFNEKFAAGVCCYIHRTHDFSDLPNHQFGQIVVWDHLNYINEPEMLNTLQGLSSLLRPGGTLTFTFNDCDHPHGMRMALDGIAAYTTQRNIENLARRLELAAEFSSKPVNAGPLTRVFWGHLTASGQLVTQKAHPTLCAPLINITKNL